MVNLKGVAGTLPAIAKAEAAHYIVVSAYAYQGIRDKHSLGLVSDSLVNKLVNA